MEKIGILGSGIVGQTLAAGFIRHGYSVMVGTGSPGKLDEWKSGAGKGALVGSFQESAGYGKMIVLAVKGKAAKDVLDAAGKDSLKGKIIIDVTNPIEDAPPENGVLRYFTNQNSSLMEELQASFPDAHFVKAFNSIGNAFMVNPDFDGLKPSMFICGNDEASRKEVSRIVNKFGFIAEDMGKAEAARAIEPLCILWCIPGFIHNDWSHAFRLLRKK